MSRSIPLFLSDLIAFYGALVVVLFARYGSADFSIQWQYHLVPFSLLLIVWVFALYISNLYDVRVLRNDRDFFDRLTLAITVATLASLVFFYFIPYFGITPKRNLFFFLVALAIGMWLIRSLSNRILASGTKKNILIVGITQESLELARLVAENPQFGFLVRAFVSIDGNPSNAYAVPQPILTLTEVGKAISAHSIDTVVISPAAYENDAVIQLFYASISQRVNFISLAAITEHLTGRIPLGSINQSWFLDNLSEGSKKSLEPLKRAVDIIAATLLGIPTLLITPIVIAGIWLSSPGYPFFHQQRTGRGGKPFTLIKFRSMVLDAEKNTGAVWAAASDARITKIGSFLRKTRIDELPQLWNILRGEMSLIGPRAERPEFDAQLAPQIPFYNERYLIKPGLSGWAQINYPYGASVDDARKKLEYDLFYLKHRSVWLDIEIILKTISISLRRSGR